MGVGPMGSAGSVFQKTLMAACLALVSACTPYLYPKGPISRAPVMTEDAFVMSDGAELPMRRWNPEVMLAAEHAGPTAVVLALHGFNDYSNAFDTPARAWSKDGILTIAYDQRGFGEAPHRGRWAGVDTMTDDLLTAARLLRDRYPKIPLVVLGESMGAAVVMAAAARHPDLPADRLVLSAPAVWGRDTMPGWQRVSLDVLANTLPWLEVSPRHIRRVPSDNIEMLRALGRDPLIIKRTRIDALWGLVNLMDAARDAAPLLRHDSLILYGAKEDILPADAWRSMIDTLPRNGHWKLRLYSSGFHMLLRDLTAAVVIEDISRYVLTPDALDPAEQEARLPQTHLPHYRRLPFPEGDTAAFPG